jgi:hypothetical protein
VLEFGAGDDSQATAGLLAPFWVMVIGAVGVNVRVGVTVLTMVIGVVGVNVRVGVTVLTMVIGVVGVNVRVGVTVAVKVKVLAGVSVPVGVSVKVAGGVPVAVGATVGESVAVKVRVLSGVSVPVGVSVKVAGGVPVAVSATVGESVAVKVRVLAGVSVPVGVSVNVGSTVDVAVAVPVSGGCGPLGAQLTCWLITLKVELPADVGRSSRPSIDRSTTTGSVLPRRRRLSCILSAPVHRRAAPTVAGTRAAYRCRRVDRTPCLPQAVEFACP